MAETKPPFTLGATPPESGSSGAPPSKILLERARMLWEQTGQDLKTTRKLAKTDPFHGAFMAIQVAANSLGVVGLLNGRIQMPLFDLNEMVTQASDHDPRFAALAGGFPSLEEASGLNPFTPPASPEAAAHLKALAATGAQEAERAHELVRGYLKDHQKVFFSP